MSVLIKDMEMPTSCTMCWLNTFCGVWNTEPAKHKGFNKRLEDCPLTEHILCRECKHMIRTASIEHEEGDVTNYYMCDYWHRPTDEDGYCHVAKLKGRGKGQ